MWLIFALACGTPEAPRPHDPTPEEVRELPAADRVTVSHVRARAMPPSAPNSGAFMTLTNPGAATAVVKAVADVSDAVELHTHVHEDGVMKMRPVERIDIPKNGETVLKPGGLHIMFIGLRKPMVAGDSFDLTLTFDDDSTLDVTVHVEEIEVGGH